MELTFSHEKSIYQKKIELLYIIIPSINYNTKTT